MSQFPKPNERQPIPLGQILGRKCAVVGCKPNSEENIYEADDHYGHEICAVHAQLFQAWMRSTQPVRFGKWLEAQNREGPRK